MRITIEFDNQEDAIIAMKASDYRCAISCFKEELRMLFKHWNLTEEQESVRDRALRVSEKHFGEFYD